MERQTRLSKDLFKALGEFKAVTTSSSGLSKTPRYMIDRCQKCLSDQTPFSDNKRFSAYGISNLLHYSCSELMTFTDANAITSHSSKSKHFSLTTKLSDFLLLQILSRKFNSIQFHKGQILATKKIIDDQKCETIFVTLYDCYLDKIIYRIILNLFGIYNANILTLQELEESNFISKLDDVVYLVPITSSYDSIRDTNKTYDYSPTGLDLLKFMTSDVQNYGATRVDILQPLPLKIFWQSIHSRVTSDLNFDIQPSKAIINHLRYDLLQGTAIMSTHLVSFLLLTRYRHGASVEQLTQSCEWLIDELYTRNVSVGFTGDSKCIIQYACKFLTKNLVCAKSRSIQNSSMNAIPVEKYLMPSITYPHVLELKNHANHISVFQLESVLAVSLISLISKQLQHTLFSNNLEPRIRIQRTLLIDRALSLCKLLRLHHVFNQPCYSIDEMIELKIELMINRGYLIADDPPPFTRNRDRYGLYDSDSDDDYQRVDDPRFFQYIIVKQKRYAYRAIQMFYNILSPTIDSYLIVGESLRRLLDGQILMRDFLNSTLKVALSMIDQLMYEESINEDNFKNGLYQYQDIGVIIIDKKTTYIKLTEQYNSEQSIDNLMKSLNLSKYKLSNFIRI